MKPLSRRGGDLRGGVMPGSHPWTPQLGATFAVAIPRCQQYVNTSTHTDQ